MATGGVLLALAASIGVNVLQYKYARLYYIASQEVRLDPAGLLTYNDTVVSVQPHALRVVLFGDSRAQMWNTESLSPSIDVINRGIGSQSTRQVLDRIEPHLLALSPDIVVFQAGVNDLKNIGLFPEKRQWIVDECKRNIHTIVDRASSHGATVILTTIFPTGAVDLARLAFWSNSVDTAIVEVNAYLRTLANARVHIVDAYEILARDGVVDPAYDFETLHINTAGYAALNAAIAPLLVQTATASLTTRSTASH